MNNPNISQNKASNPLSSVWVSASAGTGKTKILIDRIIKLLLYNTNLSEIICITYTDNAAKEMKERLLTKLSHFAITKEDMLIVELQELLGVYPSEQQIDIAKKTFIYAINNPKDIKIQTIHSLCQTILSRFPQESNVPVNFENIEGETSEKLKKDAIEQTLKEILERESFSLHNNFQIKPIINQYSKTTLFEKISSILNNTLAVIDLINYHKIQENDFSNYHQYLCNVLNVPYDQTLTSIINDYLNNGFNIGLYYNILDFLNKNNLTFSGNNINKEDLKNIIDEITETIKTSDNEGRLPKLFNNLYLMFATTNKSSGELHIKKILTKPNIKSFGEQNYSNFLNQVEQLESKYQIINKYIFLEHNLMFVMLAVFSYYRYEKLKQQKGYLDYNDQIHKTNQFLNNSLNVMPWIMFKLDSEINHILVDEAQDTSPKQWEIINFFVKEFFSGESAFENKNNSSKLKRTLFVVGDVKQSIYSFQGADAAEFINKRHIFKNTVIQSNNNWEEVNMKTSFRSGKGVIDFVNLTTKAMFQDKDVYKNEDLEHIAFKDFDSQTEVWPVIENSESSHKTNLTRFFKASDCIVDKIKYLIQNKNINYKDIVLLYTKRDGNIFLNILNKVLKDNNIPVLGIDKIDLRSNIAILDLIVLGKFFLQTSDNLSLACALKSPIFGLTDEDIILLTANNKNTIFQNLSEYKQYKEIYNTLNKWILLSKTKTIYELYFHILYVEHSLEKFISRLGTDCIEILNDFLDLALTFKKQQFESLHNFIFYIQEENPIIKRDIATKENAVSLSTIHSYKGLQNKVVFILNNLDEKIPTNKLLYINNLILYKKINNSSTIQEISHLIKQQQDILLEERYRLLYVGITRASHYLYICNIAKIFSIEKANAWYHVFDKLNIDYQNENNKYKLPIDIKNNSKYINISHTPLIQEEREQEKQTINQSDIPSWVFQKYENTDKNNLVLNPSKLTFENKNYFSPLDKLSNPKNTNINKGILIHKILENLTLITYSPNNIETYLYILDQLLNTHKSSYNLTNDELTVIRGMILNIIQNPIAQFLFNSNSINEVSISGILDSKEIDKQSDDTKIRISGRIDKIIIDDTNKLITIVDYKFSRFKQETPNYYRKQIHLYSKIIQEVYPKYKIKSYILYTIDCKLAEII